MASPAASASAAAPVDHDEVARRLLGWERPPSSSEESLRGLVRGRGVDPEIGRARFRRASEILASREGRIVLRPAANDDDDDDDDGEGDDHAGVEKVGDGGVGGESSGPKDPRVVVEAYFRLIDLAIDGDGDADDGEQWARSACDLLKRLGESIKAAMSKELKRLLRSDEAKEVDRGIGSGGGGREAILLYFRSVLSIVAPRVPARVRLLAPTYRYFTDAADEFASLLDAERNLLDRTVRALLPAAGPGWREILAGPQDEIEGLERSRGEADSLFEDAAHRLLERVDDAATRIRASLLSAEGRGRMAASFDKTSKVIVFLFARVASLLSKAVSRHRIAEDRRRAALEWGGHVVDGGRSSGDENEDGISSAKRIMAGFLRRLVDVSHLAISAKAGALEDATTDATEHRALFEALAGLRPRAEGYLSRALDSVSDRSTAAGLCLECFVELDQTVAVGDDGDASLAKLHMAKFALKKILTTEPIVPFPKEDAMTKFVESLLFVDVPRCHHLFVHHATSTTRGLGEQAREVLTELLPLLERASHVMCRSERDADGNLRSAMVRQHQLLVRWLAPTTRCGRSPAPARTNHPLTDEVLFHLISERISTSCAAREDDRYCRDDASHLVSLLSRLLFHPRTETVHRQNVATLLVRLLSPASLGCTILCSRGGRDKAILLTVRALWSDVTAGSILVDSTAGGRKRKRNEIGASIDAPLPPGDARVVCRVLEALAESSIVVGAGLGNEASAAMRRFWDGIVDTKAANRKRSTSRFAYLLSISAGMLRATSNLGNFHRAFGGDPERISSLDTIIDFVELQMGGKAQASGRSARKVMMHSVCVRLIGTLSECTGGEVAEAQAMRMGTILRQCVLASEDTSTHSISLQLCAISTTSKMGRLIRSDFSEGSIEPLVDTIKRSLSRSSWSYIAPCISNLEYFVKAIPNNLKALAKLQTVPNLARMLLTSRLQGKVFSIEAGKPIQSISDDAYSAVQESQLLLSKCCNASKEARYLFERNNSILLKTGSKVLVHRSEDGEILAVVVAQRDKLGASGDTNSIFSFLREVKNDEHTMVSNCAFIVKDSTDS